MSEPVLSPTDADLLADLQDLLQESPAWDNGLWTRDEVLAALTVRQHRFLFDTRMTAATAIVSWTPDLPQLPLPADWITTIRVAWHDLLGDTWIPLPPSDLPELVRTIGPDEAITVGIPQAYRELDTDSTRAIALTPAPTAPGEVELVYVGLAEDLDGTGQGFTVPDDWVPYVKYGALADLLGKDGRGQDLLRSRYAEARYQEGVVLAQALYQGWGLL